MYVAFLGTGNALPSVDRANTSLALAAEPGASVVLIDCGGDPYRNLTRAHIGPSRVSDLIITHAHIDHLAGLPSLIESFRIAGRTNPLRVFAIDYTMRVVRGLLDLFSFELTLDKWPFAVDLRALAPGQPEQIGGFTVMPLPTDHAVPSVGLRFTAGASQQGLVIAYTSDTRLAPSLTDLARNASLFIAEATYFSTNEEAARTVGHLTVAQAAEVAAGAQARALGLVHLSVPPAHERKVQREARHIFHGETLVPHDGMVVQVNGSHLRRQSSLP
jgi:ribonuclease Z